VNTIGPFFSAKFGGGGIFCNSLNPNISKTSREILKKKLDLAHTKFKYKFHSKRFFFFNISKDF